MEQRLENSQESQTPQNKKNTFLQQYDMLPEAIKKRFVKQIGIAVLITILVTIILFTMKAAELCLGYLLALYVAYLGLDMVWSFHSGKIISQRMLCVKATKFLKKDQVKVILREIETGKKPEDAMHTFYICNSKQELAQLTPGTVLTVYYKQGTTDDLIAWTIIGSTD